MKFSRPSPPRQPTGPWKECAPSARDEGNRPGPPVTRDWVVRVPASFLDDRGSALGHRKGWMLLILEGCCRARCYCWVGNAELARRYGCSESALLEVLKEMQAEGLIYRVPKNAGRPGRLGIILLKRADADLPTAVEGEIPDVIRMMGEARTEHRDRARGQTRLPLSVPETDPSELGLGPRQTGAHDPGKPGPMTPENRGHHDPGKPGAELRVVVVEKDEPEKDEPGEGGEGTGFQRQRQRPDLDSGAATEAMESCPQAPGLPAPQAPPQEPPRPQATVAKIAPAILPQSPDAGPPSGLSVGGTPTDAEKSRSTEDRRRLLNDQVAAMLARQGKTPRAAARPALPPTLAEPVQPASGPPGPDPVPGPCEPEATGPEPPARGDGPEWVRQLKPEAQSRFHDAPPAVKRDLDAQARSGITPKFLGYVETKLRTLDAAPPPEQPKTTAELLEGLPGAPPNWPQMAAEALARDFGTPKDRKLWEGFLRVTMAVWQGRFPAVALADAYRQGMNPASKNPGAVFNTALQRDHGWIWEALGDVERSGPRFDIRMSGGGHDA